MEKDKKFLGKLFMSIFLLSASTFGGGYVIVPLMKKKFVERLKWLEEEEMLDLIGIAQSTPGAIAVNTSILVGYKLSGVTGALIALAGAALPPLIVITAVFYLYGAIRDNALIDALMRGMQIGVAVVIVDAVVNMAKNIIKGKSVFQLLMLIAAFALVYFKIVNLVIVIFAALLLGVAHTMIKARREKAK